MTKTLLSVLLLTALAAACYPDANLSTPTPTPTSTPTSAPTPIPTPTPTPTPPPPLSFTARPHTLPELYETRILQTCALNAGVCHNGSTYPDMHDLEALKSLIQAPCGLSADTTLPNACEPAGDHIVNAALDVEITRVDFDSVSRVATLTVSADVPLGVLDRFTITRPLPSGQLYVAWSETIVSVTANATTARTIALNLTNANLTTQAFFQPQLPLREDHIHEADVNHDGLAGFATSYREIVPGAPEKSYLVARLWDAALNPELMPRQCRVWNDEMTRALGCWVEGLRTDAAGAVTNFDADIDYVNCTFQVGTAGRCGSGLTVDDILDAQCAGCHGATQPQEGLDLRAIAFRASTVNRSAREDPTKALVSPGHPESSYLWLKVTGDPTIHGAKMPQGTSLTEPQLDAISSWISAGAP